MDAFAVGTTHGKSTAHRGPGFIDAAIHMRSVQGHAPTILAEPHDVESLGGMGSQVFGDLIVRLQDDCETAACSLATGTMGTIGLRLFCESLRK